MVDSQATFQRLLVLTMRAVEVNDQVRPASARVWARVAVTVPEPPSETFVEATFVAGCRPSIPAKMTFMSSAAPAGSSTGTPVRSPLLRPAASCRAT